MRSTTAVGSYAAPQRRADYVAAMRAREYGRRPGPMLVYASATPGRRAGGDWQQTLEWVCAALPAGVVVDTFTDAFPGGTKQYQARWRDYATDLDGLLVLGERVAEHAYLLGPSARAELRTVIGARLPVLLCTPSRGLVPVVDCRPERVGRPGHQYLRLTVPAGWSQSAPTLRAALQALTPAAHLGSPIDTALLGMNRRA